MENKPENEGAEFFRGGSYQLLLYALTQPLEDTCLHKERLEAHYETLCECFADHYDNELVRDLIIPNLLRIISDILRQTR